MLKDLLASLQQAAAESEQRRSLSQDSLTQFIQSSMPTGQPGRAPKGKGKQQGKPQLNSSGRPRLDAFLNAISTQESGGNYDAVGIPTKYGTAYGKYQILDSNIKGPGGWDKEVLGRDINIDKFLNTPRLQEKIARGKLTDYFKEYGARGAAKAWYAGPGNAYTNSDAPQYGGPSINDYAASVLKHMMGYLK